MPAEQLQALLREFQGLVQAVLQSGEVLDDSILGQIAEFMNTIMDRIEQQRNENPAEGLTPETTTKQIEGGMPSSNVEGFAYDDKTGRLLVRFLGDYPNRNGSTYAYGGVPREIFDLFQKGAVPARTDGQNKWGKWWKGKQPSLGASLYTLIKQRNYPYQRVS